MSAPVSLPGAGTRQLVSASQVSRNQARAFWRWLPADCWGAHETVQVALGRPGHELSAALDAALADEPAVLTDPVTAGERISAVDVLRGVALLGISLINITLFGLPCEGKRNLLLGSSTETDTIIWFVVAVLFEGKMRALFSILFGSGVILLTERFERRGDVGRWPMSTIAARCGYWPSGWSTPISCGPGTSSLPTASQDCFYTPSASCVGQRSWLLAW